MWNFYFSYVGNKKFDIKFFKNYINLNDIETFVEPFCGWCAISHFLYWKENKKNLNYVLNDNDPYLISFLKKIKNNKSSKFILDGVIWFLKNNEEEIINNNKFFYNYLKNNKNYYDITNLYIDKFYIRRTSTVWHFYRKNKLEFWEKKILNNYNNYLKFDWFFCNEKINYFNDDYMTIFEKYKDNEKAFLFLDPPYLWWNNKYYFWFCCENEKVDEENFICDNTEIYINIKNFIETCKCKVLLIINKNKINEYLFKNFIKGEYIKIYQLTKYKWYHLIISNY